MKALSPTPTPSFGWQGQLHLVYADRAGTTVPIWSEATAPLKLQKPLYPDSARTCHSVLVHTAGGMVGGDQLDLQVQLQPQTQVLITTAAANKIYRSSGALTQQTTTLCLEAESCLEWFPQETIVFNGAQYRQTTRIELAPGATWVGWDITRFGRSARGEQFLEGQWRSQLEIWSPQGQPLWIDRQYLDGGSPVLQSQHGLAGYPVIASFVLIGMTVPPAWIEELRDRTLGLTQGELGLTRLPSGLVCRYRGSSSQEARRSLIKIWQYLRSHYGSGSTQIPRVWAV